MNEEIMKETMESLNYTGYILKDTLEMGVGYIYILGKYSKESIYCVTYGTYTENGKLEILLAKINEINNYFFVELVKDTFKEKEIIKQTIKNNLLAEILPYDNTFYILKFIKNLDVEFIKEVDTWAVFNPFIISDVYTVIFVPEKLIISEKKRIWMDLLFLSKYIGALDQNEIPLIFWGQYFKLSYQIFEDLNELGFGSFIVENNFLKSNIDKIKPEKTYEWYVLQIIQTLIECQIEENEKKKKECYKKLVSSYLGTIQNREKDQACSSFNFDIWKEIGQKNILIQVINAMMENAEITDECLLNIIHRLVFANDKNENIDFWCSFFKIQIDNKFPIARLLFLSEKCGFYCERGNYEKAKKEMMEVYKELMDKWDIMNNRVQDKSSIKDLGNSIINTLYLLGEYKSIHKFYDLYKKIKWKGIIFSTAESNYLIMLFNNNKLLSALELDKWYSRISFIYNDQPYINRLCEYQKDKSDPILLSIIFDLIRIHEGAELICRNLVIPNEHPLLENVGYYTSYDSFMHLLGDKEHCLKIMNACYMNDFEEGYVLPEYLKIERYHMQEVDIFFKSFSVAEESAQMWDMYADEGRGCFINVEPEFFNELERKDSRFKIYRMGYISEENEFYITGDEDGKISKKILTLCNELLKNVKDIQKNMKRIKQSELSEDIKDTIVCSINDSLHLARYLFKRDIFVTEKELRIIYEDDNTYEVEQISLENNQCKIAMTLPTPMVVKNIILGPCMEKAIEKTPYIAYKACEIVSQKNSKENFLKRGVKYSKLSGKLI